MLAQELAPYGRIFEAETLESAIPILELGHIDLALVDLDLEQKLDGLKFLRIAKGIESIVLSSHDEESIIEEAFELGAIQFLNKWDFNKYLKEILCEQLSPSLYQDTDDFYKTSDVSLKENLNEVIQLFNRTDQALLIEGETGVGKGVLAKNLGKTSSFTHINLSEFSKGTLESELFGHVKGAFTGALEDKEGLFKKADGGVLFLDEIGTLSTELQKKILRVIEEKSFYPVGSNRLVKSNFRLITATCDKLKELIKTNEFREDLYYRISGIRIEISPLRNRVEDISNLIKDFNKTSAKKVFFSKEALRLLLDYKWSGNYRELLAFLEKQRAVSRGVIKEADVARLFQDELSSKEITLNEEMIDCIKSNGLGELLNIIEQDALKWAKKKSMGKLNESMRLLKISKSLFYRIQADLVPHAET